MDIIAENLKESPSQLPTPSTSDPIRKGGIKLKPRSVWSQIIGNVHVATIQPMVPHALIFGKLFSLSSRWANAIELDNASVGLYRIL